MTSHTVTTADLARLSLFAGIGDAELAPLAAAAERRRYADGEPLFVQGRSAATLFAIEAGGVLLRSTRNGRSTIVMSAAPGDVLGWSTLRPHATSLTTGRAVGDTVVIAIPTEAILALLGGASPAARQIVRRLFGIAADHLEATQAQLQRAGSEGVITAG